MTQVPSAQSRTRARRHAAGFLLAALLLAAAVVILIRSADAVPAAFAAARNADPLLWVFLLALPALNCLLSAESFLVLTRRTHAVPRRDMLALIASAWLLNFLPLRPGLVGRIAFHTIVHKIPVRDSARVVLESVAVSAAALALLAAAVLLFPVWSTLPLLVLLTLAPGLYLAHLFALTDAASSPRARVYLAAVALRLLDTAVWSIRYLLVFRLVGHPIDPAQAFAIAVVAQVAMLIPLAGNGLGLREWAVGLLAASLPAWFADTTSPMSTALAADLLNRAAEIVIALPVGLLGSAYAARRLARHTSSQSSQTAQPTPKSEIPESNPNCRAK
jgi:hypothetical protein